MDWLNRTLELKALAPLRCNQATLDNGVQELAESYITEVCEHYGFTRLQAYGRIQEWLEMI